MTESQEQLLADARNYVTEIYTRQVKPELVFHTLEHTEDVVEACSYMASAMNPSMADALKGILALFALGASLLFMAALFQLFDGAQVAGFSVLRGAGDTLHGAPLACCRCNRFQDTPPGRRRLPRRLPFFWGIGQT